MTFFPLPQFHLVTRALFEGSDIRNLALVSDNKRVVVGSNPYLQLHVNKKGT